MVIGVLSGLIGLASPAAAAPEAGDDPGGAFAHALETELPPLAPVVAENARDSANRVFDARLEEAREGLYVETFSGTVVAVPSRGAPFAVPEAAPPAWWQALAALGEGLRGVDLFVELGALEQISPIVQAPPLDRPPVRLWLADRRGRSWALRAGARAPEVQLGPRLWMQWQTERENPRFIFDVAARTLEGRRLVYRVVDTACAHPDAAESLSLLIDSARRGWTLVVATTQGLPGPTDARELAVQRGIDLVVVQRATVCGEGGPGVEAALAGLKRADSLHAQWSAFATPEAPRVLQDVWRAESGALVVVGPDLLATEGYADRPSWWLIVLAGIGSGCPLLAGLLVGLGLMIYGWMEPPEDEVIVVDHDAPTDPDDVG